MYTNQLIDAYKEQMKYVQYKQIAHDLGVSPQMITEVRKGRTYLNENQILMLAEAIGEDKEIFPVSRFDSYSPTICKVFS